MGHLQAGAGGGLLVVGCELSVWRWTATDRCRNQPGDCLLGKDTDVGRAVNNLRKRVLGSIGDGEKLG